MNKTFLIFLMIGTAMMIAVIGQHTPKVQLDYMPWEIDILEDGTSRAFGITLGKTTVQEANQIFANFAETRLLRVTEPETSKYRLIARYDQLTIGGLVAEIQLDYQLNQNELQAVYSKLSDNMNTDDTPALDQSLSIDKEMEMSFLNTAVNRITFIPAIDFGEDIIRQRFGQAAEEIQLDDKTLRWSYPQLGLIINIYSDKADEFLYSSLK